MMPSCCRSFYKSQKPCCVSQQGCVHPKPKSHPFQRKKYWIRVTIRCSIHGQTVVSKTRPDTRQNLSRSLLVRENAKIARKMPGKRKKNQRANKQTKNRKKETLPTNRRTNLLLHKAVKAVFSAASVACVWAVMGQYTSFFVSTP